MHNTRPRWLRRISRGTNLILLAVVIAAGWPFAGPVVEDLLVDVLGPTAYGRMLFRLTVNTGYALSAVVMFVGIWLPTSAEGYPPADLTDRRLRKFMRLAAVAPIAVICVYTIGENAIASTLYRYFNFYSAWGIVDAAISLLSALVCVPLPLLVFVRFRGLARRARSAHLAEHCAIVGIGASSALLYFALLVAISANDQAIGLGQNWIGRSDVALALITLLGAAALLFILWSVYLLVRFAVAFRRASRQLNVAWRRDDRSALDTVIGEPVFKPTDAVVEPARAVAREP